MINNEGQVYHFTKFLLVSILKIFSFFGVFSIFPYGMALNFYVAGIIVTRSWYIGLLLYVSCIQLVPLPSRGDTVSTRPGLRQYPLFN